MVTEAELRRWLAGRHDWEDHLWEDHCGDPGCDHPCCERAYVPAGDQRTAAARQLVHDRLGLLPK